MNIYNRTIEVGFEYNDLMDVVTEVCRLEYAQDENNTPEDKGIDVSVSDVYVNVDLIHYQPDDKTMQLVIDTIYQGYTPQKGIDYWTNEDINEINNHIYWAVDESALRWQEI